MRHDPGGRLPAALFGEVLPGGDAVHSVRCRSRFHLSLGHHFAPAQADGQGHFGLWEMLVYIGIFLVGFFYVWKKGVLDWGETSKKRGNF